MRRVRLRARVLLAERGLVAASIYVIEQAIRRAAPRLALDRPADGRPPRNARPQPQPLAPMLATYGHGGWWQVRRDTLIARMESSYGEHDDDPDHRELMATVDRVRHLPLTAPEWSPYATAVRALRLCAARAELTKDPTASDLLHRSAVIHRRRLGLVADRHLRNNHRTTIELARFLLSRDLGDSTIRSRLRLRAFLRHAANGLGEDGAHLEGSFSYGTIVVSELSIAASFGLTTGHRRRAAELRNSLVGALDRQTCVDHAPGIGDTFHAGVPPVKEVEKTVRRVGRVIVITADHLHVTVSLGSIGPRGFGGHGHFDAGSIEVFHDDHGPLVLDPGCSTYVASVRRTWERSHLAHNMATPVTPLRSQPAIGSFGYLRFPQVLAIECDDRDPDITLTVRQEALCGTVVVFSRRVEIRDGTVHVADRLLDGPVDRPLVRTFFATPSASLVTPGTFVRRRAWSPVRRREVPPVWTQRERWSGAATMPMTIGTSDPSRPRRLEPGVSEHP